MRDSSLVRTIRLVAAAVARRAGRDEDFVEEVRLAVGEACGLLVSGAGSPDDRVSVLMQLGTTFTVWVSAPDGTIDPEPVGYDELEPWALLRGLVDEFEVQREDDSVVLRMCWPAHL
ncbi:MAG TPA: ATP-binding protein [Nocardioidaceae bacterium]|nr:ATP-binding protein [Nocardioidaceae bacterium]